MSVHPMRLAGAVALAIFGSWCFAQGAAPATAVAPAHTFQPAPDLPGAQAAALPTLFPSSHASNLLLLRNGDLLCFWFSGSDEGASDVGIVFSRLPKGSRTWQPARLIDHNPAKSYQNPVPFEAPDGTLWLLHTEQSAGKGQADSDILKVTSRDGGRTWTKPSVLFAKPGSYDRQPIVLGDHGEWLLPIYYSTSAGITRGAQTNYSAVEVSRDHGKTWGETRVPDSEGLVQMNIVKLGAGRYVAFFRSRYADSIFRSTSANGWDWTAPKATPLPNNNASIQATKLTDGRLVMAFDNARGMKPGHVPQTGPRAPLSLALSDDAGLHWQSVRDLELPDSATGRGKEYRVGGLDAPTAQNGREEYSYPSVLQMPDGQIITTYTFRRLYIKAVRVTEAWIRAGHTSGVFQPGTGSGAGK